MNGRILVATHNRGKLGELEHLLAPFDLEVVTAGDLQLPEPEETGESYEANALLKARAAASFAGMLAIADDSGLEIAGLDGAPGLHTARVARAAGGYRPAMRQLWEALRERHGPASGPDRAALVCVLALAWPDGRTELGSGRCEGHLVWPPRDEPGPGFLPFFEPEDGEPWIEGRVLRQRAAAFAGLIPHLRSAWGR